MDQLDPETRRRVASLGGKMAHKLGFANEWTSETAKQAAAKSLEVRRAKKARRERKVEMSSIKPTIGRKVYFYDNGNPAAGQSYMTRYDAKQPFDATVIYVWSDTCVNLRVTDHVGNTHSKTSVPLRDPSPDDQHGKEYYATWMPFQVGQAKAQLAEAEKEDSKG